MATSDYIVYVDESGDHGLTSIDPHYPMFVLAFCIFRKDEYSKLVAPAISEFKFKYFGHDSVVLHEHEIRKTKGPFKILFDPAIRSAFYEDLNRIIAEAPFTIIASAIKKNELAAKYIFPENPYNLALAFGLERIANHLGTDSGTTHLTFECRGRKEDAELELEFRRVQQGANARREPLPFEMVFASKQTNSAGLQLADLVARPIGRKILDPKQVNRAYDLLKPKIRRNAQGRAPGWGLKIFP